jgi:hypothetical protein
MQVGVLFTKDKCLLCVLFMCCVIIMFFLHGFSCIILFMLICYYSA